MESEQELRQLRIKQEKLTQDMSVLVLQSIIIFGVPAVLGYFSGVYLESSGVVKVIAYVGPLIITFILSWVILMRKLYAFKKEVEKNELEIQRLAPPVALENKDNFDEEGDLK